MKYALGSKVGAAAALAAISAAAAPPDAAKTIAESEAAWVAAEVTGDPSVAQRVLADDYVGVFPDGRVADKATAVSFFTPANKTQNARLDYVHVRVFGDTAIAQGQETDIRRPSDPYPSGRLIFTDVFLLRDGAWRLVNSEDQFQPLAK